MSTTHTVHTCPRCDLRFTHPVELLDHLDHDHPEPVEASPSPHGRVVLAVDPARPDPATAVAVASALANQLGAALEVVAAAAPGLGDATTQAYLMSRVQDCRNAGATWVSSHNFGSTDPAEAINAHVGGTPATWICLASHARTAVGEKVFGSVTADIVRDGEVPVIVIGPSVEHAPEAFTRVMACVDRSPAAPLVAAAAAELADRLDARLVLTEVSLPNIDGEPTGDGGHVRTLEAGLNREADTVLLPGHAAWRPILDLVDADPTTILVTGRRPPGAAGRFVFGSVALNLARHACGPVMIVPGGSA